MNNEKILLKQSKQELSEMKRNYLKEQKKFNKKWLKECLEIQKEIKEMEK